LPQSSASITFDMQAMVVDPHQVENALAAPSCLRSRWSIVMRQTVAGTA